MTYKQRLTTLSKTELIAHINELEVKADIYSRQDWEMYLAYVAQINMANSILLDKMIESNEVENVFPIRRIG